MSSNFCKYLTNQVRVEYGNLRPCCWFTESVDVSDVEKAIQFRQELKNIVDWESAKGRCNECLNRESKGLYSPRLDSLSRFLFNEVTDDSTVSIEIQIDKDCNGACLICGPWNSTTWEKYENKIKNIPIREVADPKIATYRLVDQIHAVVDFSSAREILFLGGEPLKTDSHLRLLENVSNSGQTTLQYTTNGSYQPDEATLETWSRFKEVVIHYSIDAIGEHFNYLRWPLQWHQIENNLKFLTGLTNSNIKVRRFSYTTSPFSLFYHDRYEAWAEEFFRDVPSIAVPKRMFGQPWQPRGISPMKLSAIPPLLQTAIREKYGPDHEITRLLEPYSLTQYQSFMQYIKKHDKHRQLHWYEVFPEMQKYFR